MRKALLVVLILSSALAWAQGGCTGQKPLNGVTTGGYLQALANQKVRVCSDALNPCTAVPLFSDAALTQVLANPVTTDAAGNYQYCAAAGAYNEQVTSTGSVFAQVNNTPVTIAAGDVTQAGTNAFSGSNSFANPIKETRAPQNLVAAGDSISHGNQVLFGDEWPSQAMNLPMFRERGTLTNTAVVGYTCANMTSDYVTKVQPLRPSVTGVPTLLSTLIGRNNFSGGNTAATVEACVSAYWAQARTDGFKIIAFTVYDTTGIVSETERNAYNAWVRANGSLYDYLVDTDAAFPSFTDTTLISDQIHPTARGHNLIANLVNAAVGGVSNFPTTAKSEVQAAAIVRAPIFSAEPSATAAGSVFAYNLTTSMNRSSYERGVMFWNANTFEIGSEMADPSGFGLIARSTRLKSALDIKFAASGTDWWQLRTNGALFCITDATCDIGQVTNNRPNNVYVKNNVLGGNISASLFLRAWNSAGGPGESDTFNATDSITSPVNFSRIANKWVANTNAIIGTEAGGTGTVYPLHIRVGTDKWSFETSGALIPVTDASFDIGQPTNRPNNVYVNNVTASLFLRAYNSAGGPGEADVFNTVDSITAPVNFERGVMKWAANTLRIGSEAGGTGTLRPVQLVGASVGIGANGTALTAVITGTATLTYTAIAAQTCQEQPVTVTNSSTTNFGVTASPRATLGNTNLSWSAWVSAAGTVSVRVCNPSAGSITPTAVAWGVTVTQ